MLKNCIYKFSFLKDFLFPFQQIEISFVTNEEVVRFVLRMQSVYEYKCQAYFTFLSRLNFESSNVLNV